MILPRSIVLEFPFQNGFRLDSRKEMRSSLSFTDSDLCFFFLVSKSFWVVPSCQMR